MKKLLKCSFFFLCLLIASQVSAQTYNLVWSDEFNGTGAPDPAKWGYELGYQRNNELQYYTNSTNNTRQNNGNLEVTVLKEAVSGYNYTSGSITTEGKASWTYGKIEGRFKMPKGQGLWAAFWALGTNSPSVGWPACGEIDLFEHVNNETNSYHTVHWADAGGAHIGVMGTNSNIDVSQWHVYSIIWDASNITWYVDNVQVNQFSILNGVNSTEEFHLPQYVIINLAIGGSWPGNPDATTVLPATMYCDYIRVYQAAPAGNVALSVLSIAPTTVTIPITGTNQMVPSFIPYNTTNKNVTWTSSNTAVATVSSAGLVSGIAAGTATITATSADGGKTATCAVTVKALLGVNLLLNPKFDLDGTAVQVPQNWLEWSSGAFLTSSYLSAVSPYSLNYKCVHTGATAYDVATYQLFTGIPNGTYTAKAWVRSSGGQSTAALYAQDNGHPKVNYFVNTSIPTWTQVVLNNIVVSNNQCSVGLYSVASAGQWIEFDNVEFYFDNTPVTGVSMSPTTASVVAGATTQLTATIAPANATNQNVSWSTSAASIATVSTTGLVTGVAAGTATITVTTADGAKAATCTVTVTSQGTVANLITNPGFELNGASQTPSGWSETGTLAASYSESAGGGHDGSTNHGTHWTASGAYEVYTNQMKTGLANGNYTAKAWVKSSGGQSSAIMYVDYFGGSRIQTNIPSATTWTQITIPNINVTNGQCEIGFYSNTTASGNYIFFDNVEFYSNTQTTPVTGVSMSPTTASVVAGATTQLTATIAPANATNQNVSWSTSAASIATVSTTGLVTGVAAGTATITVTTADGAKVATCTVTVTSQGTVTNLITNPGFELNGASQTPSGWSEYGTLAASYSESAGGGHDGSTNHGTHWTASGAYEVYTYQMKTGLANGNYTAKAWVKSSGGQSSAIMYVEKFGGSRIQTNIPSATTWTQITIPNINVTNGECEIGFYSNTTASGNYIFFDNVEFYLSNLNSQRLAENVQQLNVKQLNENPIITIFPNPIINNLLNIQTSGLGEYDVVIVDVSGRVVLSSKVNGDFFTLNTSVLKSGLYFVKIMNNDFYKVEKIIVK